LKRLRARQGAYKSRAQAAFSKTASIDPPTSTINIPRSPKMTEIMVIATGTCTARERDQDKGEGAIYNGEGRED